MNEEVVQVAIVAWMMGAAVLLGEWQARRARARYDAELTRLRRDLGEHQRRLAEARNAERETQCATVRTRLLQEETARQRDTMAQELAYLRERYIDMAGTYRHLAISRLAEGVNHIKINRN